MTYERFEIGDVIMREGDNSNNKMYYITLIIIIKVCNHTRLSFYNKKNIKKCLFFGIIESFKFRWFKTCCSKYIWIEIAELEKIIDYYRSRN